MPHVTALRPSGPPPRIDRNACISFSLTGSLFAGTMAPLRSDVIKSSAGFRGGSTITNWHGVSLNGLNGEWVVMVNSDKVKC